MPASPCKQHLEEEEGPSSPLPGGGEAGRLVTQAALGGGGASRRPRVRGGEGAAAS